jgi:translation initiation factor IF-3
LKDRKKTLVNKEIRANRVIVINPDGEKMGEFLTRDAINLASEQGLDLVQVSHDDRPTCKMMDYGKFLYDQKKKAKKSKAASASVKTKEIRLRPKTEENDVQTLVNRARKFLEKGYKVKVTVRYKGREGAHLDLVREQCLNVYERLKDVSKIDDQPKKLGRQFSMTLAPL